MNRHLLSLRMIFIRDEIKRANYLRKKNIFHHIGNDVLYQPIKLPLEPYLVSIGDNVKISANVSFITHDVIQSMLLKTNKYPINKDNLFYMGKIVIGDNVVIGSNSTILYDVTVGSDSIIAAGSVVSKDVPEGAIVGGAPAKVIGSVADLANKRIISMINRPNNLSTKE